MGFFIQTPGQGFPYSPQFSVNQVVDNKGTQQVSVASGLDLTSLLPVGQNIWFLKFVGNTVICKKAKILANGSYSNPNHLLKVDYAWNLDKTWSVVKESYSFLSALSAAPNVFIQLKDWFVDSCVYTPNVQFFGGNQFQYSDLSSSFPNNYWAVWGQTNEASQFINLGFEGSTLFVNTQAYGSGNNSIGSFNLKMPLTGPSRLPLGVKFDFSGVDNNNGTYNARSYISLGNKAPNDGSGVQLIWFSYGLGIYNQETFRISDSNSTNVYAIGAPSLGVSANSNQWVTIRMEVTPKIFRIKVWQRGSPEPDSFQLIINNPDLTNFTGDIFQFMGYEHANSNATNNFSFRTQNYEIYGL